MLQILITDTVGPVPSYKKGPAPIQVQWTGCGSESVPRSVLTLIQTGNCLSGTVLPMLSWKGMLIGCCCNCW